MISFLSKHPFSHKTVLLRVDFNVSLHNDHSIADDTRIRQAIPTIKFLLRHQNKIILVSHLGQPKKRSAEFSLKRVARQLAKYIPSYHVHLLADFRTNKDVLKEQHSHDVIMLENIRFYPEEKANDTAFAKELAGLADVYVNDAFGVSHRLDASVIGIPTYLPSYAGLLMEKEITMLNKLIHKPQKPFVAILGGSKISTKIKLLHKLIGIADVIIVGGGLANTLLLAQGYPVGKSMVEKDALHYAKELLAAARKENKQLLLPVDVVAQNKIDHEASIKAVKADEAILDIGTETQAIYGRQINLARTIVWNGPVGKFEDPTFARGTEYIYYAITQNTDAISIVGGGDTLAAINNKEYLDRITHISTGGGAMLEYIEKGTLPGIEALHQ